MIKYCQNSSLVEDDLFMYDVFCFRLSFPGSRASEQDVFD